jgi:hypothetical protein
MEIWRYGDMEIWRYGDMEIWRYGDMEICDTPHPIGPYSFHKVSPPLAIWRVLKMAYNRIPPKNEQKRNVY